MTLKIFRLAIILSGILLGIWFLHQQFFVSTTGIGHNLMTAAYCVNYALGMGVYVAVLFALRHHPMITGYVFLSGSAIKFLVFFLFFYPLFTNDSNLSRVEFAVFFVPYIATLTTTVVASARALITH